MYNTWWQLNCSLPPVSRNYWAYKDDNLSDELFSCDLLTVSKNVDFWKPHHLLSLMPSRFTAPFFCCILNVSPLQSLLLPLYSALFLATSLLLVPLSTPSNPPSSPLLQSHSSSWTLASISYKVWGGEYQMRGAGERNKDFSLFFNIKKNK